jgi:hypothetical protein
MPRGVCAYERAPSRKLFGRRARLHSPAQRPKNTLRCRFIFKLGKKAQELKEESLRKASFAFSEFLGRATQGLFAKGPPRRPSPAAHSLEARPKQQSGAAAKKYIAPQESFSRR